MKFQDQGYTVVRGLLTPDEVEGYVRRLESLSGHTRASFAEAGRFRVPLLPRGTYRAWTLPDGVSKMREFWPLITSPKLLEAARALLGPDIRYLQHSDLHVGFSAVTWHRDSVNRHFGVGPDWDEAAEPYRLVRVGLYLQSFEQSRFALRLVPGSHRLASPDAPADLARVERRIAPWSQALALVTRRDPVGASAVAIETNPGDAILFDPRILHAGSEIQGPKYSIFLAYGMPGRHFTRHAAYYRYLRRELKYADLDPELRERLEEHGLAPETGAAPMAVEAYRPSAIQRLLGRGVRPDVGLADRGR